MEERARKCCSSFNKKKQFTPEFYSFLAQILLLKPTLQFMQQQVISKCLSRGLEDDEGEGGDEV